MKINFSHWPLPRIIRLILAAATVVYALWSGHYWIFAFTAFLLFLVVINYGCPFMGTSGCSTGQAGKHPVTRNIKKMKL
jgi:hypothetical protein